MTDVHAVLPDTVHRADRPSGGNVYDRRLCDALATLGWTVREHLVGGTWPHPDQAARAALARVLDAVPTGAVVLVDGLVASGCSDVLVPQAHRLRLVILVHMPFGQQGTSDDGERQVLTTAAGIVTTSEWTRARLQELYAIDADRLHVAVPGVDRADVAPGTDSGGRLLCVAAVTPGKGHDLLVDALGRVDDLPWSCMCAGSLEIEPLFVAGLRQQAARLGLDDRVRLVGPLSRVDLDRAYAAADLVVLASRAETYGMVVTEALARGLPVLATAVGGLPEALGARRDLAPLDGGPGSLHVNPHADPHADSDSTPGLLVRPEDSEALARGVRWWLTDAALRERLRMAARERRSMLPDWTVTAHRVSSVLARLAG
ncbi:glycosyltransferase family 4 protein [Monashia sp. NPDC004114]